MKILFLSLILSCQSIITLSQSAPIYYIRPLTVGDTVSDIGLTNVINYSAKNLRLSDFKGKLIILDFWATWCGSCIAKFPYLDSLQEKYKNDLQIILVNSLTTGDTKDKIVSLFEKRKKRNGQSYKFLISIKDSILEELFPHATLPHYVWIAPGGKIIGVTSSKHITKSNIEQVIKGRNIDMPYKKDFDLTKPLFLNLDFNPHQLIHYSTLIKGRIEGLPNRFSIRQFGQAKKELTITNMPIFLIYQKLATELIVGFTEKQMIINVRDSSELILDNKKFNSLKKYEENIYTYELISSDSNKILYNSVLADLNKYTNYYGRVEKRTVRILSLIQISTTDRLLTKGGDRENRLDKSDERYLKNVPIHILVNYLNKKFSQLVIDNTSYTNNIDFYLPNSIAIDNNILLSCLRNYGLELVQKEKEIEMFVITQNGWKIE